MENNWLPIGSVVKVGKVPVLISGYEVRYKNKFFDYIGFLYPLGIYRKDCEVYFNSSMIEEVLFEGYKYPQFGEFVESLEENKNNKTDERGE